MRWSLIAVVLFTGHPLELSVHAVDEPCNGTGVFLNGLELLHKWNEGIGHGSGAIPPFPKAVNGTLLLADWRSVCKSAAAGSPEVSRTQDLAVQLQFVGDGGDQVNVGFTASFTQVNRPRIFRICPLRRGMPLSELFEDDRAGAGTLELLSIDSGTDVRESHASGVDWNDWRKLGCRLKDSIFGLLGLNGCSGGSSKSLPSSSLNSLKQECYQTDDSPTHSEPNLDSLPSGEPTHSTEGPQLLEIVQEGLDGFLTAGPLNGIRETADDEDIDFPSEPELKALLQTGTVAILLGTLILLTFMVCRNTTYCRRKQADRAARREERRARRAYKSAAQRLKWRQWWEGWGSGRQTPTHVNHDLSVLAQPGQDPDCGTEADLGQEPHAIRNELLDFRQTLLYVGQLVRKPKEDLEGASSTHSDRDREIAQRYTRRKKHPAPPSTAGISTVISLDTNSLLSFDTTSSVTLDTLETLETAPPSYRP
ncbi:uncharacterized protein CDV56_105557 [Aspergillus thermomutatus]|uniref:Uncharacterized protein n=1 Tax=Aspergillus thermomutatus TaxID=41047 RepID=A0A397GK39_ASPTH|nr:uncharacterized protein CDV56_105557 [Aspergillus thermomutatus]RHZ51342.1 hypothetical protein CDV56_105557 [Aspergillus thermomutatus]